MFCEFCLVCLNVEIHSIQLISNYFMEWVIWVFQYNWLDIADIQYLEHTLLVAVGRLFNSHLTLVLLKLDRSNQSVARTVWNSEHSSLDTKHDTNWVEQRFELVEADWVQRTLELCVFESLCSFRLAFYLLRVLVIINLTFSNCRKREDHLERDVAFAGLFAWVQINGIERQNLALWLDTVHLL